MGLSGSSACSAARSASATCPSPAVGWPLFLALGVAYFAMAYLLLGSVFLAIGSMATHGARGADAVDAGDHAAGVPVLLRHARGERPRRLDRVAGDRVPVQLAVRDARARGAGARRCGRTRSALLWQALWVALSIRLGAALFRKRVMKSGPQGEKRRAAAAPRARCGAAARPRSFSQGSRLLS